MPTAPVHEVVHEFDKFDLAAFSAEAARFGQDRFGFVVTPNVDHLVRLHEDAAFRDCYQDAAYVLLDSRVVARLIRIMKGVRVPVCPGSDVTLALLAQGAQSGDRIIFIGGSAEQSASIAARFQLANVRHHNPPMGFITDRDAVERCLEFIEGASPFRFCWQLSVSHEPTPVMMKGIAITSTTTIQWQRRRSIQRQLAARSPCWPAALPSCAVAARKSNRAAS
jgi:hypothetical protein